MIEDHITIKLPVPWSNDQFDTEVIGPINYLVGPNGSGKSRFAVALLQQLKSRQNGARLLGTDRLREMANPGSLGNYWGDHLSAGYAKTSFSQLRRAGEEGSGIDTVLLLEERVDLCIRIEATLSHLFAVDVSLEWDSGHLIPKAVRRETGDSYRLDREECHGIKELLVLLTHLYDFGHSYLIIDEPELNLHPQYQAFFMEEVHKVAGNPNDSSGKKILFLITHSPFILDLRSEDNVKSVISFDLDYSVPRQVASASSHNSSAIFPTVRLNAHYKQLFFADNPVFVEGHHDALMVGALLEARGLSVAAAGSCIIDCGGLEEVNHYLNLCQTLGKEAHFIYDLDSVFKGQLRSCIGDDESVRSVLASAGIGSDFVKYVGELEQRLTGLIDLLLDVDLGGQLKPLNQFLIELGVDRTQWGKDRLKKARVAMMVALGQNRDDIVSKVQKHIIEDIEGRWKRILEILADKNIHVLPGGTIERYLPYFAGDLLDPKPEAKRNAIVSEIKELQSIRQSNDLERERELLGRYGDLYRIVSKLPSKAPVDLENSLRMRLSDYVHQLQKIVEANHRWGRERIETHMSGHALTRSGVVVIRSFRRSSNGRFDATLGISEKLGDGARVVEVCSDTTIQNLPALRAAETDGT